MKYVYIILFFMVGFIFVTSVFALKVKLLQRNLRNINSEILANYEEFQNLKAEWNYLNNPKYLADMARKYLPDAVIDNSDSNNDNEVSKLLLLK